MLGHHKHESKLVFDVALQTLGTSQIRYTKPDVRLKPFR